MANELSQRPKVDAISIASHKDLSSIADMYAIDPNFEDIMSTLAIGKKQPFDVKHGFHIYSNSLCGVTCNLREKVMYESHASRCVVHRGTLVMLKRGRYNFIGHT